MQLSNDHNVYSYGDWDWDWEWHSANVIKMGNSRNCVNHDRRQQNARNRDYEKRLEKTVKIKTNIN